MGEKLNFVPILNSIQFLKNKPNNLYYIISIIPTDITEIIPNDEMKIYLRFQ